MTAESGAHTCCQGTLSLLGATVFIDADRAELLEGLTSIYAAVPPLAGASTVHARLRALHPFVAELTIDHVGVTHGVAKTWSEAGAATAFALFHTVARRAIGHLVLHAGTVQFHENIVLIVAPSRLGKTTLTVELALRGAAFLSDEAAPLSRQDGLVLPFPRAVGVRPGPLMDRLQPSGILQRSAWVEERGGQPKVLVDLSSIVQVGRPGRVAHVVFLTSARREQVSSQSAGWLLEVDRLVPAFTAGLQTVPGVESVEERTDGDGPAVFVRARVGTPLSGAVDRLCADSGSVLVRMVSEDDATIDWQRDPEIAEVAASGAILRVARHLLNGRGSALVERELGGSVAALVIELATALSGARFWSMSPGRLEAMCERIEQLP